jgi:hypothetical protein
MDVNESCSVYNVMKPLDHVLQLQMQGSVNADGAKVILYILYQLARKIA